MKNYYQTSRIQRKKKIFQCFLSIHKSLGNVLITNSNNNDNLNEKYEILNRKVRSKHKNQPLELKNYLKRKKFNDIFNKINLSSSHNNEESKNLNISRIQKSKFAEKYNELYNITTNNNDKHKKREKSDSLNYLTNRLKVMNNMYDSKEESKDSNYCDKNYVIKQSYNNLKKEIYQRNNNTKYSISNSCMNNLSIKVNNKSNGNYIRKKIYNKIDDIKSALKSIEKMKPENKNNVLVNNYISNPKKVTSLTSRSNNSINKLNKYKSCIQVNDNFRKYNKLKRNAFINNAILFGNDENERIIHKVNYFKVRLNLLSMK
jgi:hypothetical protein